MKFLFCYIILLGYVFAEDKTCSEIKSKMKKFEYEFTFSTDSYENKKNICDVYPNDIEGKLYLLFICINDEVSNSRNYIFAHKCDDEITKISDIKRFSINTFNRYSSEISISSDYYSGNLTNTTTNIMFRRIPIPRSDIPQYHKEITYLLLARKIGRINPTTKLKELGYDYKNIEQTLKLSYQTISSPIIYCKQSQKKLFITEIEFFPVQTEYYFCQDKDLARDFLKTLIMQYNEIIDMKLPLMMSIHRFKSSLEKLIKEFQQQYEKEKTHFIPVVTVVPTKRRTSKMNDEVGLAKKSRVEYDKNSILPKELEYKGLDDIDSDELFPELKTLK